VSTKSNESALKKRRRSWDYRISSATPRSDAALIDSSARNSTSASGVHGGILNIKIVGNSGGGPMRVLCLLSVLMLSGCGYSADDYWEMAKSGVARSLCNAANKGATNVDCMGKEGIRPY
jgi:hypothetical protein